MRRFVLVSITTTLLGAAFACGSSPGEQTDQSASDLASRSVLLCAPGKACVAPITIVPCIPGAPNCSTPVPGRRPPPASSAPAPSSPSSGPSPAPPGQSSPAAALYQQTPYDGEILRCDAPPAGEACAWIPNALCSPVIPDPNPPVVTAVALGAHATYALGVPSAPVSSADTRAAVYSWGLNADYELGNGTTTNSSYAAITLFVPGNPVTAIAAGDKSACALLGDRSVRCWGTIATLPSAVVLKTPTAIALPAGTAIGQIAAGEDHACALTAAGTAVYCWVNNDRGQLGDATSAAGRAAPYKVPLSLGAGVTIASLVAGGEATCALDSSGAIWCWGDDSRGSLGNGFGVIAPAPGWQALALPVAAEGRPPFRTPHFPGDVLLYTGLAGGGAGTFCGRTNDGWWCWGANDKGQAGIRIGPADAGATAGDLVIGDQASPLPTIAGVQGAPSIAIGTTHMCFGGGGEVSPSCFGADDVGQLGRGASTTPATTPQGVTVTQLAPWNAGSFTSLAAGGTSTCAILPRFSVAYNTALGTDDAITQATFTNLACWGK